MRFQRHATVGGRMALWPAGCILIKREPGTQRRPEGGNDETSNHVLDDLMMTAGVASAQTLMNAEIPFAFSVGNHVVEPGTYRVGIVPGSSSNAVLRVQNVQARNSVMVLPQSSADAPRKWIASGLPRLGFDCSTGACVLMKVWFGRDYSYQLHPPKAKGGEMLLTEIVMTPDRGN
jgi:hypothetical protein